MSKYRIALALSVVACLLTGSFLGRSSWAKPSQASDSEQTIWKLEHEYWRLVQANDLPAYRALWHKDFLGWPWVNTEPVRKDHITDWITSNTSKGLTFKSIELKPTGVQVTGDIAVAYYGMTYKWVDKDGKGAATTIRVTHHWRNVRASSETRYRNRLNEHTRTSNVASATAPTPNRRRTSSAGLRGRTPPDLAERFPFS